MPPPPPPASEPTHFGRDLALLLGIPFAIIVVAVAWWQPWQPGYTPPAGRSVFDLAAGTWDWTTHPADSFCVAERETISFSPDHKVMMIRLTTPWRDSSGHVTNTAVYDLWSSTTSQIRGQIRGETRKTDAGQPVVWDLELTSGNSFRWHRADWGPTSRTAALNRCPEGTPEVGAL